MSHDEPGDKAAKPPSIRELSADIERTRAELGDVVEALVAKLNFPRRARNRARRVTARVTRPVRKVLRRQG